MPASLLDVSRETLDRLELFSDLVSKWTKKINLISRQTTNEIWERHILDSAQLYDIAPPFEKWVDLGSGGGFPGIVVAILAAEKAPDASITLVESDQRKCAFLRTALRELEVSGSVIAQRIDQVPRAHADVLSARALADLSDLLGFAERHLSPDGVALFPKGAQWASEHDLAQRQWSYHCEPIKSITNPEAAVLKIKEITRV